MNVKGFGSVAMAYPAAAASGATLAVLEFAAFSLTQALSERLSAGLTVLASEWWVLAVAWVYAFVAIIIGLLVIGTPVWLAMAGLERDRRHHAVLGGAMLAGLAGFLILQMFTGDVWSWGPAVYGAGLAIPGGVAGWVLHRVAYG
jgi:hypothetical protein